MKLIRAAVLTAIIILFAGPVAATKFGRFRTGSGNTGTTPSTVSVSFAANGTIQVHLGSKLVGSGIPTLQWSTPSLTTGSTISSTHGKIVQSYADKNINIVYDVILSGTDLTVTASVTNNSTQATGPVVLVMPAFTFAKAPTGTMPSWHFSYIGAQGDAVYHPSMGSPLGCVYAADTSYAVAAWSPSEMSRQSLIQGAWVSNGVLANPLPIELHTKNVLAPGNSMDMSLVLRVTTDQTPAGLLSGYKLILPAMSYTPVGKPLTAFQSIDSRWVTATDPYGYNMAFRRLDLPQGVQSFQATVNPLLRASGGGGVVFWAPGGYQAGSFYPIDFDVNLNRIQATWPSLVTGFHSNGYRLGICARLGDSLNADGSSHRADPANAGDVSAMLARIDACTNAGIDMWYVDSACSELASTTMCAIAKKHLPANHVFFTEYANDISLSFAGVYCEWMGTSTRWLTEQQRTHLLELYPKSEWLCMDRSGNAAPAKLVSLGFEPLTPD